MASRFVLPFADVGNGISPGDGEKLFFFATGTSTPRNTYSDNALTIANSNPVISDSEGVFSDIFLLSGDYKVQLKDKNDVLIWEADPVSGFASSSDVSQTFQSKASMLSSANGGVIQVGDVVETIGYFGGWAASANPPKGGNHYELVDAGSAGARPAEDGGSVIHVTGGSGGLYLKGLFLDGVINVAQFGAVGDDVADDSGAINAAVDVSGAFLPAKTFLTTSAITFAERDKLKGEGASTLVGGTPSTGARVHYTGAGSALNIDGEWVGFDSRRSIDISGFSIHVDPATTATAAIQCDFLTQSKIHDMSLFGHLTNAGFGVQYTNSYNNSFRDVLIDTFDKGIDCTIKAAPNDVFSGQTEFSNVDFWNCRLGTHIRSSVNVLAQMLFNKCHWKTNTEYGLVIEGANVHSIRAVECHFEENTLGDVWVKSDVVSGPVIHGRFNNTLSVDKILDEGVGTVIEDGTEFVSGGSSIHAKATSKNLKIGRCRHTNVTNPIVIDAGAQNTFIARQEFVTTTGTAITDNGSFTRYEGERTFSFEIDLANSGAANTGLLAELDEQYWLHSVKFTNATALSGAPNMNVGRVGNLSEFVNGLVLSSTAQHATQTVPRASLSAFFADAGRILSVYNATGAQTGKVLVEIRAIPWKFF